MINLTDRDFMCAHACRARRDAGEALGEDEGSSAPRTTSSRWSSSRPAKGGSTSPPSPGSSAWVAVARAAQPRPRLVSCWLPLWAVESQTMQSACLVVVYSSVWDGESEVRQVCLPLLPLPIPCNAPGWLLHRLTRRGGVGWGTLDGSVAVGRFDGCVL